MAVAPALLEMLVCPVTKQPLERLSAPRLANLNRLIEQGRAANIGGQTLTSPLEQALITCNGTTIYPVTQGIPVMLEGEGIAVKTLFGFK